MDENKEKSRKLDLRELQMMQLETMKELHQICVENNINYYLIAGSLLGAVRHKGFIPWDDDIDIAMMRSDYEKFKEVFEKKFDKTRYFLQHYDTDKDFRPALMRLCIKGTYLDFSCESHWNYCKNTYIDIFPLDNVPNEEHKRISQEKSILRLKYLLRNKLYRIHKDNHRSIILLKKLYAFFLYLFPLKYLQKRLIKVMQQYRYSETKCVCSMASQYKYAKQTMDKSIYGKPTLIKFEDAEFWAPEHPIEYLEHLYGRNYMQLPPIEKRCVPCDVYFVKK